MRKAYSLMLYLALPVILAFLALRGIRDRGWLTRWGERFARYGSLPPPGGIVIHAASMGEVNAAASLVTRLLRDIPEVPLTVTTFTPTGSRRVRELFGQRVHHYHTPLDLPPTADRFFAHLQPRLLVVMETEIWPNLFAAARQSGVPVILSNARLSEASVRGYRRVSRLIADALGGLEWAGAQTPEDAERLVSCGAPPDRTEITGNIKFDLRVAPTLEAEAAALRQQWGDHRPVLTAGSTRPGDEAVLIPAFKRIQDIQPDALLIMVPRHPERFSASADAARAAGMHVSLRSEGEAGSKDTDCLVVDTMGELMRYYACSDVAFVGGTFADIGGHNLLEPAALGKPVLFGPYTRNIQSVAEQLEACGGGRRLASGEQLTKTVLRWFDDEDSRVAAGSAALNLVESGRGALERNLSKVREVISRR